MKLFYALLVSAVMASGSVASATSLTWPKQKDLTNPTIHPLSEVKAVDPDRATLDRHLRYVKGMATSRAEEELYPAPIDMVTTCLYIDYFNYQQAGNDEEIWYTTDYEIVDNLDGTYTLKGFLDYSIFNLTLKDNGDETVSTELGTVLYETESYKFILVAIFGKGEDQVIAKEGEFVWNRYINALVPQDVVGHTGYGYLGVGVLNANIPDPDKAWLGFEALAVYNQFFLPNARLTYTYGVDTDTPEDIENYVYTEFDEEDETIMVSNVMPWNSGITVNFGFDEIEGYEFFGAIGQIAYPSEKIDPETGKWTGLFYMLAVDESDNSATDLVFADFTETGITWPVPLEDIILTNNIWFVMSEEGYGFKDCSKANLDFVDLWDFETGEPGGAGVTDIVDSAVAAPVYYNIQGMPVHNPIPGQLYIVKEGSKVSKQIIR